MRRIASDSAEYALVGTVDVARWEQFGLEDTLPFRAMWYTVPPDSSSPQDCHPEYELSVVISGTASVEASGQVTDVEQGSCFLLDSREAHVIHNRSADTPLFIFTTYWMPEAARAAIAAGVYEGANDSAGDGSPDGGSPGVGINTEIDTVLEGAR
jgi:mannose-6-phosphate isomerase-like protein (cupin superfamily)